MQICEYCGCVVILSTVENRLSMKRTYGQGGGLQQAAQGEEQVQKQEQSLHSPAVQPECVAQSLEGTPGRLGKPDFLVSLGHSPAAWLDFAWSQSSGEIIIIIKKFNHINFFLIQDSTLNLCIHF